MSTSDTPQTRCTVTPSDKNFSYWIERDYVPEKFRAELSKAQLLVVPWENFRELEEPMFPSGTEDLMAYLRSNAPNGAQVGLCIGDDNYREVSLHADVLEMATFVFATTLWPTGVNVISNYIYDKLKTRAARTNVHCQIYVTGPTSTYQINYEGPANTFESTVAQAIPSSSDRKQNGSQ